MESHDAKLRLGTALHQQGRLAEAEKLYREVLQQSPKRFDALYLLGIAALASGKPQRAIDLIDRSIKQNPGFPPAWCNRGLALAQTGRLAEALASIDRAIALDSGFAEAHYNRGNLLKDMARPEEAIASFDAALIINPNDAEAHNNRGLILNAMGRYEEGLAGFDMALALQPRFAGAHCNRGNALSGLKRLADALDAYDRALAIRPDLAEAWCNRGDVLHELNRPDDAVASFRRALALNSEFAEAHFGLSLTLLATGHYGEGFRHHEWRNKRSTAEGVRRSAQKLWLGDRDIAGRTLLIHPELFLGDMINFCRYAVLAAAKGANVVLAVQEPLVELLASLGPGVVVVSEKQHPGRFDFHCPLMSLPLAFGTAIDSVPATVPYLRAEAERVGRWKQVIGEQGFRIGICWQGSAASVAMDRAFEVGRFAGIAGLQGVRLISLQTGDGTDQLAGLPVGMRVESYDGGAGGGPRPFVDTAAMMENLDLIISADTAIAHLAGALGRPTWIVLKQVPDWRWGLQGATTPWYPTARLFRQKARGDWDGVFADLDAALGEVIRARPGGAGAG